MKKPSVTGKIVGWLLGLGGTVATAAVVSILVPFVRDNLVTAWNVLRGYLESPVPAWTAITAGAAALALGWLVRRIARGRRNPDTELLAYTTDTFGPWHFHWTWTRDRFGRRAIRHLSAICSVHDLVLKKEGKDLVCPRCHRIFPALEHDALDHFRQTIARKAAARYGIEL
jgi:hypothetical protein